MSDQPPADWYTDPEDESQYRYWDGSAWTEHRAPRHAEPDLDSDAGADGLRGPGELIGNSFSLIVRQWRGCAVATAISLAGQILFLVASLVTLNGILKGEVFEIWDRATDPAFDPEAPDQVDYFESLEFDFSVRLFVPLAIAALIVWVASNVMKAAVTRLALADLHGRALSVPDALRQALSRVRRLMGLDLQIFALVAVLAVLSVLIVAVAFAANPVLLVFMIPVVLAAVALTVVVIPLAYAVASAGPSEGSLRYATRLVRGRAWAVLGRMLLIMGAVIAVSIGVGLAFAVPAVFFEGLLVASQIVQTVIGVALGVVVLVAAAILYDDLGGGSE